MKGYSTDNTKEVFLKTKTQSQKLSFSQVGGKGANIIKFLDLAKDLDSSYFGMFDTDVNSIETDWIVKMLGYLQAGADYVIPSYQRSPFEGSTTNHFCAPIIQCLFRKSIEQPICGDFMFNKYFVSLVTQRLKESKSKSNLKYGIDIFLTTSALLDNLNVLNCPLTKKTHKPSFPKIENMFIEVASSFLDIIKNNNISIKNSMKKIPQQNFIENSVFSHKEQAKILKNKNLNLIKENWSYYNKILDAKTLNKLSSRLDDGTFDEKLWSTILLNYLRHSKRIEKTEKLTFSLKNLFICRAVTFWEQVENISALEASNILQKQTILLQKLLEEENVFI